MNGISPARIAIALLVAIAAYSLGRFHRPAQNGGPAEAEMNGKISPADDSVPSAVPEEAQLSRSEQVLLEVSQVAEAARTMSLPDSHTYAFFENLNLDDLDVALEFIATLPAGNEQDVLNVMAIRQWAKLDGPGALYRAAAFPTLGTRSIAKEAVYTVWAENESEAALLRAVDEPEPDQMIAGVTAVIAGAAMADPKDALTLWNIAPRRFLDSPSGQQSLEQLVDSAYGTGKRDNVRQLIEELPPGDMKTLMANALVANWARHYPNEAHTWLSTALPPGDELNAVTENMFASLTLKDPEIAANWAAEKSPEGKRPLFIAAAVAQWARIDLKGVEIWMNEQPSGNYLDGANFALAKHFLDNGQMKNSFAWIRRVNEDRGRAELLVRLGRRWSKEQPQEFERFLEESSLSEMEVEMLMSGIDPET